MRFGKVTLGRLRVLFRKEQLEEDLHDELHFHLEMQIRDNIERGMTPDEARRAARRQFGNGAIAKEASRAIWSFGWLETLGQDLRYGVRSLLRSPGLTVIAVLSLALGIGANSAVFSILSQVQFRSLPFPNSDRIVMITERNPSGRGSRRLETGKMFALQEDARSLKAVSQVSWGNSVTLSGEGFAERTRRQVVDVHIFSLFGAQPQLGRLLEEGDVEPGGRSEGVVISHNLWQRAFGGTRDVIGESFLEEGVKRTVIGVMPPGFWMTRQPADIDFWRAVDETNRPQVRGLPKYALLQEGVTIEQARAEAEVISGRYDKQRGDAVDPWPIDLVPLREVVFGRVDERLWTLQWAVGLVLLIACVNVANMMLARGAARRGELTVRAALGAPRSRIARLLFTESLILGLLGGLAGILVALVGIRIFVFLAPQGFPMLNEMRIDSNVLIFMAGVSVVTGVLFGLFPVLQSFKLDLNSTLKEGARDTLHGAGRRLRGALLVSELALATALLGCAGLLINGLMDELNASWGYRTDGVLAARVSLDGNQYWTRDPDEIQRIKPGTPLFWTSLLERVRALPGVESAGVGSLPSFFGWRYPFSIVGRPVAENKADLPRVATYSVDPGFFDTLEIPLIRGRYIAGEDSAETPWTTVIDRTFADRYFPNEDPIGKAIRLTRFSPGDNGGLEEPRVREIVGVVENVRGAHWVTDPPGAIYHSYLQTPTDYMGQQFLHATSKDIYIRAAAPAALAEPLRQAVAELDPTQVPFRVQTLESTLANTVSQNRFYASLLGVFAAMAIVLAAVGIFGVISFSVNQRRGEFGLRMALGAQRESILRLVLRDAMIPTVIGLAIGIAASFGFRRLLDSLVSGLTAVSPLMLGAVVLILAVTAVLAALVPACRAATMDPMRTLRHE